MMLFRVFKRSIHGMKKNNIITVVRVFIALILWLAIYKCYGYFIDPKLEGLLPEVVRMIIRSMVVPYTLGLGAFYLVVKGMETIREREAELSVTPVLLGKGFLVQMGISMPLVIIVNILCMILGIEGASFSYEEIFGKHFIYYLILLLIFNPVFEELLFRGFVLGRLRVLGDTAAIIISSVFFALPHFISQGLPQVFATFAIALVWGYVRIKPGKLWPCMILHGLFNLYGSYFVIIMSRIPVTSILVVFLNMFVLPAVAAVILIFTLSKPSSDKTVLSKAVSDR